MQTDERVSYVAVLDTITLRDDDGTIWHVPLPAPLRLEPGQTARCTVGWPHGRPVVCTSEVVQTDGRG